MLEALAELDLVHARQKGVGVEFELLAGDGHAVLLAVGGRLNRASDGDGGDGLEGGERAAEVQALQVEVLDLAVGVLGVEGGRAVEELLCEAGDDVVGLALRGEAGAEAAGLGAAEAGLDGGKALVVEVFVLASRGEGNEGCGLEVVEL